MGRARRRHALDRKKAWASRVVKEQRGHCGPKTVGRTASTPCMCSGYCCGNPRKWNFEKSRQEQRVEMGC